MVHVDAFETRDDSSLAKWTAVLTNPSPSHLKRMNVLGSVFLGDAARQRVLSPSPSSPPMSPVPNPLGRSAPAPIDPRLSLELRIRWLEVLLLGIKQGASGKALTGKAKAKEEAQHGDRETLVLKAEQTQKRFDGVVESNDGLRKFMDRCQ